MNAPLNPIAERARAMAKDRCQRDAEGLRLVAKVVHKEVWRHLGFATLWSYLEDVLGYDEGEARDRVRVAMVLEQQPELMAALAAGEHSYSAIRALTRVTVAETQAAWLAAVCGMRVQQIEDLVARYSVGELPT